jgi:hypothetical protein
MEPRVPADLPQHEHQRTGQSVRVPNVENLPLDKMLIVAVTVVQQIMAESNCAVLEKAKILALQKLS